MYTTIKEVEEIRDNKEQFEELVRKPFFKIMNSPDYYEKAPFLSCAKDLIRGLKEGMIEELSFISTTAGLDDRKRRQCEKFFPSCSIKLKSQGKSSPKKGDFSQGEPKWKWIKDNHPNFDVFIDDSPAIVKETKKEFGPEKLYVMTDYPIVEEVGGGNVCRVLSIPLSDREFKEFIQYVEDYKTLRDCCSSEFQDIRNLPHG